MDSQHATHGNVVMPVNRRAAQVRSDRAARRPPYVGFAVLIAFVAIALLASVLSPHDPLRVDLGQALRPPFWGDGGSADHLLGTDKVGRDILSRIIHGTRPALVVALTSVFIAGLFGSAIGIVAAYFGGLVDQVLMRLVDIMQSFPAMLLALLIAARLGPGLSNVVFVISLILWASYARQIRGQAMVVMRKEYVALARTGGVSAVRIMTRHVLPNVAGSIIVLATLQLGIVVILEASLSFLGVGVPRPAPTWGGMITDGRGLISTSWWLSVLPGLAILGLVLAVNLVGEWLEEYQDPRRSDR